MDPNQLLAQLRDAHAPEIITWWPLAIGWWILLLIGIALLVSSIRWGVRRYRKNAWKRAALSELKRLQQASEASPEEQHLGPLIRLVKRCVSTHQNDRSILSEGPGQWRQTLEETFPSLASDDINMLVDAHYQPNVPNPTAVLYRKIERSIKELVQS